MLPQHHERSGLAKSSLLRLGQCITVLRRRGTVVSTGLASTLRAALQ